MEKVYRACWSIFIVSVLVITALVLPNSALLAGKSANTSLNKTAVTAETPYIVLGMGCFWGSEKRMQAAEGVLDVEAGYAGGDVVNPNYETLHDTEGAIQAGKAIKNHAEVVKVYYDPKQTSLERVLIQFWESHNPTQGNRQGNDIGSNYRSAVLYRIDAERQLAEKTRAIYQSNLKTAGNTDLITTEIAPLKNYTSAEAYHQDYLEKNPLGYCGLGGLGVAYVDPGLEGHDNRRNSMTPINKAEESKQNWQQITLNTEEQLIAFEAVECGYCRKFDKEVLATWKSSIPIVSTNSSVLPEGWTLGQALFATPTVILFRDQQEVARYVGYQGAEQFEKWLNDVTLSK